MVDHSFLENFKYKHRNPYHEKLAEFSEFVMRDEEAEVYRGKWNTDVFKRDAELVVEVGSGYGHFMREYCEKNPDVNFVGIDYRFKRSYELCKKLKILNIENYRYLRAKGERIGFLFEEGEVDTLLYFFPDPWPKKRHNKKRLFQAPFLQSAYKVLKPGGRMFIKTDHDAYYEWMCEVLKDQDQFTISMQTADLWNEQQDHFLASFQTKFEKIFLKQGINIKGFELISKKGAH